MRAIKSNFRCHFSASYLLFFFHSAVRYTATNLAIVFDFIKVSRELYPVKPDYRLYLEMFLEIYIRYKISRKMVALFVALSIMINAYPKRIHRESPEK